MITTSFFLDRRYGTPQGGHPLKLVFNHHGARAMLSLGVDLKPGQWDPRRQCVTSHAAKAGLNAMLEQRKVDVDRLLYLLATAGDLEGLSVAQVKNLVQERLFLVSKPKPKGVRLLPRLDAFIASKGAGTARVYRSTRSRLLAYLGEKGLQALTFEMVDAAWLREFDRWLARTSPSANARGIHLRNLRALFNEALTDEVIVCYPFRRFKVKSEPTRKRALSVEQWRALMSLELPEHQVRYRDCFVLMLMLCGINIVDLCRLKEVQDGRVEYRRAKTHRLYSLRLEPEARALVERYRGRGQLLDYLDTCRGYRSFYNRLCMALRDMGRRIGVQGLSTYWARHTWATFAARLDIPKETIAAALGHGSQSVTDIYIDFDRGKVDAANRRVIDFALGLLNDEL